MNLVQNEDPKRNELVDKFFNLTKQIVENEGLSLYDLEFLPGKGILRVYIMNAKTKTALIDDCVRVDHAFTPFIESESWMPTSLTLEVSSPGVYRVLKTNEHYSMAIGEVVSIILHNEAAQRMFKGNVKLRGKLVSVEADGFAIKVVNKKSEQEFKLNFKDVKKANLDPDL
ncbi:MAG: hypothetical protein U0T83_09680 [Bacteriovoracaceae bacterium]